MIIFRFQQFKEKQNNLVWNTCIGATAVIQKSHVQIAQYFYSYSMPFHISGNKWYYNFKIMYSKKAVYDGIFHTYSKARVFGKFIQ